MNEWSGNKTSFHLGGEIIPEFDGAGKTFLLQAYLMCFSSNRFW
jgi:hypothetical protein